MNGLRNLFLFLSALPIFFALAAALPADDSAVAEQDEVAVLNQFRIDNVMTIRKEGDEDGVRVVTTTLFGKGMVIDFIGDNDEVIIYNRKTKTFVLLDPIHRVQTELALSEIDQFLDNLRAIVSEKKDAHSQFLLHPDFEISRSDESGELSFSSKWYEYLVSTRSFDDPELSEAYFEFIDVYTKLNLYLNPGNYTPMARMVVNGVLAREKRFPAKIRLTLYPKGKGLFAKPDIITSDHKIIRRLSEEDLGRIVRASHFSEQFPKQTFGNYYKTAIRPE
ncbi:MAG: hypothetical protein J6S40_07330 [Thermoguttaceae bacterium]|nr:hypothetical protein [Thermoguttaceae bacterium]